MAGQEAVMPLHRLPVSPLAVAPTEEEDEDEGRGERVEGMEASDAYDEDDEECRRRLDASCCCCCWFCVSAILDDGTRETPLNSRCVSDDAIEAPPP